MSRVTVPPSPESSGGKLTWIGPGSVTGGSVRLTITGEGTTTGGRLNTGAGAIGVLTTVGVRGAGVLFTTGAGLLVAVVFTVVFTTAVFVTVVFLTVTDATLICFTTDALVLTILATTLEMAAFGEVNTLATLVLAVFFAGAVTVFEDCVCETV